MRITIRKKDYNKNKSRANRRERKGKKKRKRNSSPSTNSKDVSRSRQSLFQIRRININHLCPYQQSQSEIDPDIQPPHPAQKAPLNIQIGILYLEFLGVPLSLLSPFV